MAYSDGVAHGFHQYNISFAMNQYLPEHKYRPVDITSHDEMALWHECDHAIGAENTGSDLSYKPVWEEDYIDESTKDMLVERHNESIRQYSEQNVRYFIIASGEIAGIFSIPAAFIGVRTMLIESLYILPGFRNQGIANRVLEDLYGFACASGLDGIRLETEFHWQSAVSYYLHNRYWLLHWNGCLNFVRLQSMPAYQLVSGTDRLEFYVTIEGRLTLLLSARKDGVRLDWIEHKGFGEIDEDVLLNASSTLSLYLAILGWPMERSGHHNGCDGDCGGPEGLAKHIAFLESPLNELSTWSEYIEKMKQHGKKWEKK